MEPYSTLDRPLPAINSVAVVAATSVRFPGEDDGRSLAEMAESDLDAALQLLADRAQYITGANGAAIALRRSGKNDMLCRASSGVNVPELGALLSTEFGLSGESVRTRQPLRCDDAERDARVNREVCREMGIASVVVMPVVNDDEDEVLGVFELFSGKVNAFGERDLSALQRLSEMVETAVKLAHAAEHLSEHLSEHLMTAEPAVAEAALSAGQQVLDEPIVEVEQEEVEQEIEAQAPVAVEPAVASAAPTLVPAPQKPLFWSAALNVQPDAQKADSDQSHVPPVLRNLRKCEACGFPVSLGRTFCVECEEKKWRGQLKGKPVAQSGVSPVPTTSASAPALVKTPVTPTPVASAAPITLPQPLPESAIIFPAQPAAPPAAELAQASTPDSSASESAPAAASASPELILSAGFAPSQSWFSSNKYIVGAIVVIAAVVAAVALLR